jgi:hypothetical protein
VEALGERGRGGERKETLGTRGSFRLVIVAGNAAASAGNCKFEGVQCTPSGQPVNRRMHPNSVLVLEILGISCFTYLCNILRCQSGYASKDKRYTLKEVDLVAVHFKAVAILKPNQRPD